MMEMIHMEPVATINGQNRYRNPLSCEPVCWHCKSDFNMGNIIRPCYCIDDREFIHIYCLEYFTTKNKIHHCTVCGVPFPVKKKRKPLLEWYRNREAWLAMLREIYGPLFKLFGLFVIDMVLIAIAIYTFLIFKIYWKSNKRVTFFLGTVSFFIALIASFIILTSKIKDFAGRIRESCHRWYASNQEMKVVPSVYVIFETL